MNEWKEILQKVRDYAPRGLYLYEDGLTTPPSRKAIGYAISIIESLHHHYSNCPPTLVGPEPAGGIIIERRGYEHMGQPIEKEVIDEITIPNHGKIEYCSFLNGRIQEKLFYWPDIRCYISIRE